MLKFTSNFEEMSYNFRKRSPIASIRNHIPCEIYSCNKSCDHNSLQCAICLKYFHYKCKKATKKAYQNIVKDNLTYVCS